jgi:hypothetical protein
MLRFTTAETEDTEDAQRLAASSLRPLCVLCLSVVNLNLPHTQVQTGPLLKNAPY